MVLHHHIGLYGEEWQCCPASAALLRGKIALGLMVTLRELALEKTLADSSDCDCFDARLLPALERGVFFTLPERHCGEVSAF